MNIHCLYMIKMHEFNVLELGTGMNLYVPRILVVLLKQ